MSKAGFILKAFRIYASGGDYGGYIYFARSRQKALSDCWREYQSHRDEGCSFKDFLRLSRAEAVDLGLRFGEPIRVGGEDAFYVTHDSQYVRFARAGSETVLLSHPLDVEPPEARRGTPYFSEAKP
jgi:hypothetical protein